MGGLSRFRWLDGRPGGKKTGEICRSVSARTCGAVSCVITCVLKEREVFIGNLLVQIHLIIEMILVDRPDAV